MRRRSCLKLAKSSVGRCASYPAHAPLGSGTYGEVKEATIISTGQHCAIKSIRKEVVKGHEDLVKSEMDILTKLDHENIMKLLDWFESRDKYYMVFDLCVFLDV